MSQMDIKEHVGVAKTKNKKIIKEIIMKITIYFITFFLVMFNVWGNDCSENKFAIFLPDKEVSLKKVYNMDINIDKIKLGKIPIIDDFDINVYSLKDHTLELKQDAYEKIINLKIGTLFVVCVGKQRVYWGIIWSSIRSVSFEGIVILQPSELRLVSSSWRPEKFIIKIELGYPTEEYFEGIDLRGDKRIIEALKRTGKLKD